jgi:DNA polymerase-1
VEISSCSVKEPDYPSAYDLFKRLEFKTLLKKVEKGKDARPKPPRAVDQHPARQPGRSPDGDAPDRLLPDGPRLVAHDSKAGLVAAIRRGEIPPPPEFDTMVAAYLLDPTRSTYDLEDLARQYDLGDLPSEGMDAGYWGARAEILLPLRDRLEAELRDAGMWELFRDVEMPLIPILAEMEAAGVGIDRAGLDDMAEELEQRIAELTSEIHRLAGTKFNINSTRQLGEVLFDKLGLPVIKRTKTGPSTDADVLEELAPRHDVVARILDYRTLMKLKGTYVDGLRALIDERGRIHTTFNQTITATGRLSSTEPNLQNIPIRIEEGRRIRKVFIPTKPDHLLLAADYSQIELRVLAHYSGDRALVEAFHNDQDIHTRTAAEVFGVAMDEVTPAMRGRAKAVNFGLAYGQGAFGLAKSLGIPQTEAKDFIERYFARYPGVKRYMEEKIAEARSTGFVTTLKGRRRRLPEINARQFQVRQNGERMAINTPIQGTAADIIKAAMVRVRRALRSQGLMAQMILQVHDELVFEVPRGEVDALAALARREMEGALTLNVPLRVDVKVGSNWYDMKKVERQGQSSPDGFG